MKKNEKKSPHERFAEFANLPAGEIMKRGDEFLQVLQDLHAQTARDRAEMKRIYEQTKQRDPEFWRKLGYATEKDFLRSLDLTDMFR